MNRRVFVAALIGVVVPIATVEAGCLFGRRRRRFANRRVANQPTRPRRRPRRTVSNSCPSGVCLPQ